MTNTNLFNQNALISAYVTNLGKYNEGELIGEWVSFPVTNEQMNEVYNRIGIAGTYEETFNTDYEFNVEGLKADMLGFNCGEYASIEKLNCLAETLEGLDQYDLTKFAAVLEFEYCNNIDDVIVIAGNLDDWYLMEDVKNDYDLGYHWVEESGCYDLAQLGTLANYIDYEAFGRDIRLESDGMMTDYGWIERA